MIYLITKWETVWESEIELVGYFDNEQQALEYVSKMNGSDLPFKRRGRPRKYIYEYSKISRLEKLNNLQ